MDTIKNERIRNDANTYQLLHKWCSQENVYTYFEQRILSYDEIVSKYYPRTLWYPEQDIVGFIIKCDDKPVGYIQYQLLSDENRKLYGLKDDGIYEVDIFIGEKEYLNMHVGRYSLDLMCDYLLANIYSKSVIVCTLKSNATAIKCFESCGFKKVKELELDDTIGNKGSYILMEGTEKKTKNFT